MEFLRILALGPPGKDRKDKANIGNPKVNRGCPPLTANRISEVYVQNTTTGHSMQHIPLGVYHSRGFNAMAVFPV